MKALISEHRVGRFFGRCLLALLLVLAPTSCKDAARQASEKLLEATHVDDVRDLIGQGADVNYMDAQGRTPLRNAVKYNEKSVVRLLLQSGANVNAAGKDGSTALHDAAVEGHVELAEILIGNGAELNARNKLGNTPLHDAAAFDKYKMVECLLQREASADIKNAQGKTAADCAVANNAERTQKYLASIPMTRALGSVLSSCGDKELVYKLEKFREGKLRVDEYPFLAHLCRFRGLGEQKEAYLCAGVSAIRFFIEAGADVNASMEVEGTPCTPLMSAISSGKWDVVTLLLEHHASCRAEDLDASLRGLLRNGQNPAQAEAFVDARKKTVGNIDRYTDGDSTLMDVIMYNESSGAADLLGLLLDKGADPNIVDKGIVCNEQGVPLPLSPVYAAAHKGNVRMVELLKTHGCNIDALHGGMSDLCRAALCSDAAVCRILLDNGADPAVEDSHGETPLFWAVYNNNAEIVEMLLKGGADPKAKSPIYKKTLEKLAKSKEVKALLRGK